MSSRRRATATYFLGPRIFQMGSAYLQGSDLATIARPHLEALRDEVGETAYLVMFSQGEIVQLCKADGKQAVSAAIRPMVREPAYCTATGKVLLSALGTGGVRRAIVQTRRAAILHAADADQQGGAAARDREGAREAASRSTSRSSCRTCAASRFRCRTTTAAHRSPRSASRCRRCASRRRIVPRWCEPDAREGDADHAAARSGRDLTAHDAREGRIVSLSFLLAQSVSGLTAAMFLFIVASGLSLIFGVLRVLNFAHGIVLHARRLCGLADHAMARRVHGQLLARGARRGARGGAARRRDRAAVAAPSLRPRRPLPAAVHLRAGADPRRRRARALGHAAAHRCRGRRASPAASRSSASSFRTTTCSSSCSGRRSRSPAGCCSAAPAPAA